MTSILYQQNLEIVSSWFSAALPKLPTAKEFAAAVDTYGRNPYKVYRRQYNKFSWPILHTENVEALVTFIKATAPASRILEVCSGTGWLSFWLKEYGLTIIAATDNHKWRGYHSYISSPIQVRRLGAVAAVKKFEEANIVLMSWPPYMSTMPIKVLRILSPKQTLIYIGEGPNGCNATNAFTSKLDEHKQIDSWDSFLGIHDSCYALRNREVK